MRHLPREGAVQLPGLHISGQRPQYRGLLAERVSERATQRDVAFDPVSQCLGEGVQDAPPGNGRATSVRCGTATFT